MTRRPHPWKLFHTGRARRRLGCFEPLESRHLLSAAGIPEFAVTYTSAVSSPPGSAFVEMRAAQFLQTIDLNRDGRQDIIYFDATDSSIYACYHNGAVLGSPQKVLTTPGVSAMLVGDVTGDSIPDLIVAHPSPSPGWLKIATYAGQPSGGFASVPEVTNYLAQFLVGKVLPSGAGEAVRSEYRELFLVQTSAGVELGISLDVTMRKSLGGGQYATTDHLAQFTLPPHEWFVGRFDEFGTSPLHSQIVGSVRAAGDIDGDGLTDFVCAHSDGTLRVYTTQDRGAQSYKEHVYTMPAGSEVTDVALGDLDGDGRLDVVVGMRNGHASSLGLRLGAHSAGSPLQWVNVATEPHQIAVGRFTGSAESHVLIADQANGHAFVSWDGSTYREQEPARDYQAVVATDLNQDGYRDLITASPGLLTVRYGAPDGTFGQETSLLSLPRVVSAMVFADVTGDGREDLVVADAQAKRLLIYRQATGNFTLWTQLALDGVLTEIAVGNLNGDALPDLVGLTASGSAAARLLNQGGGVFTMSSINLGGEVSARAIALADVDGSGLDDLLLYDPAAGRLGVAKNGGSGAFGTPAVYSVGGSPGAARGRIIAADFDKDGRPDVALCDGVSTSVFVAWNAGNGTFPGGSVAWPVGGAATALVAADVNADGKLDLVVGYSASGAVGVLPQAPSMARQFETVQTFGQSSAISVRPTLFAGHVDNNASPDLLLAGSNTLGVFINRAVGAVPSAPEFSIVVRSSDTPLPGNAGQGPLPMGRSWVDEWQTFWVEIWGTGFGTSIDGFTFTVDSTAGLFTLDPSTLQWGPAFTQTTVQAGGSAIAVSGQRATGTPATGATTFTLLARVKAKPVQGGGYDVVANGAHPEPIEHGIRLTSTTLVTPSLEVLQPLATLHAPTPVWAVPFDSNNDGVVNRLDFLRFVQSYGRQVGEALGTPGGDYAGINDFDRNGVVDRNDFLWFVRNYSATIGGVRPLVYPPTAHPSPWGAIPLSVMMHPQPSGGPSAPSPGMPDSTTLATLDYVYGTY